MTSGAERDRDDHVEGALVVTDGRREDAAVGAAGEPDLHLPVSDVPDVLPAREVTGPVDR